MSAPKTERGRLLAGLEHQCHSPGDWTVEGHRVVRNRDTNTWQAWLATDHEQRTVSYGMTGCLEWIAERVRR